MKISVSIATTVERADGTSTAHTENYVYSDGDNPRLEGAAVIVAVNKSVDRFTAEIPQ